MVAVLQALPQVVEYEKPNWVKLEQDERGKVTKDLLQWLVVVEEVGGKSAESLHYCLRWLVTWEEVDLDHRHHYR